VGYIFTDGSFTGSVMIDAYDLGMGGISSFFSTWQGSQSLTESWHIMQRLTPESLDTLA